MLSLAFGFQNTVQSFLRRFIPGYRQGVSTDFERQHLTHGISTRAATRSINTSTPDHMNRQCHPLHDYRRGFDPAGSMKGRLASRATSRAILEPARSNSYRDDERKTTLRQNRQRAQKLHRKEVMQEPQHEELWDDVAMYSFSSSSDSDSSNLDGNQTEDERAEPETHL